MPITRINELVLETNKEAVEAEVLTMVVVVLVVVEADVETDATNHLDEDTTITSHQKFSSR